MAKSKLLTAIQSLSKEEVNEARTKIKHQYLPKRKDIQSLFEILLVNDKLSKTEVWTKIYGKKTAFNDTKWRAIQMKLNTLLLEVLQESALNHELIPLRSLIELKVFDQRKLNKHFDSSWLELEQIIQGPRHTEDYFILSKAYEIKQTKILKEKAKAISFDALTLSNNYNELYYACQKLKNICYTFSYQLNVQSTIPHQDMFLAELKENFSSNHPLINQYLNVIFLYKKQEGYDLEQCMDHFVEQHQTIHQEEALNILTLLMNYCIDFKINKGEQTYFNHLFKLYQLGIENSILIEQNQLNQMHYKNIVTVGLHTMNLDWTASFIEKYTQLLPKAAQANAYNFNLAKVLFKQEKYDKVVALLSEVEYSNIQYQLSSKLMLIKTYYELDEDQALEALMESFRLLLIRNNKISKDFKTQYLNLLKYLKKLVYLNPYDTAEKEQLLTDVSNNNELADKQWILGKLKEKA